MQVMHPETVDDVQTAVRTTPTLHIRGGGSKPALSTPVGETAVLEMNGLQGILEYQPDEYTFTAYAGTAVSTINAALQEQEQYLPFDPILAAKGATLGGTVAANTCGSGRYRFGGVRDFILGVTFVDGRGQVVRGGSKVVKNAAGFDLPKLMVGSLGQLGVLVTLTFKVFPQPQVYVTLHVSYIDLPAAIQAIFQLARAPFEMDALDIELAEQPTLVIRLGGLADALPGRVQRLSAFLQERTGGETAVILQTSDDATYWQGQNSFTWVPEEFLLVKIPITPKQLLPLDEVLHRFPRRYTVGGNVAWGAIPKQVDPGPVLTQMGLVGLQINGRTPTPIIGRPKAQALTNRIKQALDPEGKF